MENTDHIPVSTDLQQVITTDQAWRYCIIPKSLHNNTIELFIDTTQDRNNIKEELEILLGKEILFEDAEPEMIRKTLVKYYRKGRKERKSKTAVSLDYRSEDFLIDLIDEANSFESSDIHIETYEETCRVRLRIDGKLVEKYVLKKEDYPALINKIKIKANLDIAEKRLPQDGRIFFGTGKDKFDIRVSVLPTLHGEKVVMRLLSKDATNIEIKELGFSDAQLNDYLEEIKKPHGIILISGPTGSGKTTTLYATLKILNKETTNIITIEDPIEYTLEGINQVQLKESIGLTFAGALRTFLRQDPDIIMLGEIRDGETAQMAIRAALTGHLVLSTIHTNSAWGTISRLIDMGVPPYLLADTINLTAAQRLVRVLCDSCKEEQPFDNRLLPANYKPPRDVATHYTAKGCEECFFTGYKGRKAVYEIIPVDNMLGDKIKSSAFDISEIYNNNNNNMSQVETPDSKNMCQVETPDSNIKRLSDSAFELFEKGVTSLEEIYPMLLDAR